MVLKTLNKKLAVCYIYHKGNKNFWDNIDIACKNFTEVFIINISQEEFKTSRKNLKIHDIEEKDLYTFIGNLFLTKKFNSTHVMFLESNETIILDNELTLLDEKDYNIKIKPKYHELFEYSISPFLTYENRVFYIKRKNVKDFFSNLDLFYKQELEILDKNIIYLEKLEIDIDFEYIKTLPLDKHESKINNRDYFNKAYSLFYKDSKVSEDLFNKVLESNHEYYKKNSFQLLVKLLLIKQEYNKIIDLNNKYSDYLDSNTYFYLGKLEYENKNYNKALRYFSKSVKEFNKEKSLDFNKDKIVYNLSDITHKLYKYIAYCFYELKRHESSEKYLKIALNCIDNYFSPEIYLYLGKIQFNQENHEETYKIFKQIIDNKKTNKNILKEIKQPLVNLLMFLPYKDEYNTILAMDFIDHQDDILRVADTYYMTGDFINALQLYILAVKRFGYDQKLLFKLGYISSMLKSLDQATYYFEKFLEKEPDNLDALNNLAFLYLNMDKPDLAEKHYLKILELNSYSFEANLYLAIIYMSQNKKEKAETFLEKAKTLNPISNEVITLYKIFKKEFV
ncbi:MAG: tetratricopeptide repeat protein [Candidatus Sericytochromatia bacterium]